MIDAILPISDIISSTVLNVPHKLSPTIAFDAKACLMNLSVFGAQVQLKA
jgi:hypothetical protein